jgi:hypothetical protein
VAAGHRHHGPGRRRFVRGGEIRRNMAGMKNRLRIALLLLVAPALASASDGLELAMKSKSMAAATAFAVAPAPAPAARDPLPELLLRAENEQRALGAAGCRQAASDLCYDLKDGRVVYRGARAYMPQIGGLRAESVSLRHDGFVLRYSFK